MTEEPQQPDVPPADTPLTESELPPEQDQDGSSASDDDDASSQASTEGSEAGSVVVKKKKKKKKKKGKKAAADGTSAAGAALQEQQQATPSKAEKEAADKRFAAVLKAARSEDEMLLDCSNALLQDTKAKKLLDALKGNTSVNVLNLSCNQLTDDFVQALAAALGTGSAAELVSLDLTENPITPKGLECLAGLQKLRKQLEVKTGKKPDPPAAQPKGTKEGGGNKSLKENLRDSRLVRKYFQVGGDDEPEEPISIPEQVTEEPSLPPQELWPQVEEVVGQGQGAISGLTPLLRQLGHSLQGEVHNLETQQDPFTRPHIKACLEHLHTLESVLQLTPRPVTTQFSSEPQPAVGSHRVWAADALAHVMSLNNTTVERVVAPTHLLPRVLHLALSHPQCSALHVRALRLLNHGLASQEASLVGPLLLQPGWGCGLPTLTAPSLAAASPQCGLPGDLCAPLPALLAALGTSVQETVVGSRPPWVGFVVQACRALASCGPDSDDEGSPVSATSAEAVVQRALQASSDWGAFTEPGSGPYHRLVQEQEGDLGGPRAVRSSPLTMQNGAEFAELAGGGMITGQEILALMQGRDALRGLA